FDRDRIGLAQRQEECVDVAVVSHRLGVTEMGMGIHDADLTPEEGAAFGALEIPLWTSPVARGSIEETCPVGTEELLLHILNMNLGLLGGQQIVEDRMHHRQQAVMDAGRGIARMQQIVDGAALTKVSESGESLVGNQQPLKVSANSLGDLFQRAGVIASAGN